MLTFFSHATAAKGLALTTVSCTSALVLMAPTSLTAVSSDPSGMVADVFAVIGLLLASVGWADVIYTDLLGRLIWPSLNPRVRHSVCVMLYSSLASMYAIFAFVAMDVKVHSSWILILDYLLIAVFCAVLTVSIAHENRRQ